jgi:hypothetical protein
MAPPPNERRTSRSPDALVALSRLFEAFRRREGLSAVVLADESGLPIAGAGPFLRCEDLAARCAVLDAARPANDTIPCRLDVVTRTARIRRLSVDGIEVLLCAEGDGGTTTPALDAAAAGCQRILAEGRSRRAAGTSTPHQESPSTGRFDVAKRGQAT